MSQVELEMLIQQDETSPGSNQTSMNEQKDDQQEYKSLLILNESNSKIILYIYTGWSPFCKVSTISKIIEPRQTYLHQEETSFKYELYAMCEDKQKVNNEEKEKEKKKNNEKNKKNEKNGEVKKKNKKNKEKLLGPLKWVEDKLIRITNTLECREENLADFPNEKRVCLRKIHREKELESAAKMSNLYDILGLDMKEVRKMKKEEAKKIIKKAYHKQMKIWHPDKNFGDGEIALQIITASEILLDDARRAIYHNAVDHDKGWFSLKHLKAVFWSECYTEEQKKAFWKRIAMFFTSLGLVAGGLALSIASAGAAAPVLVICGAIFGTGLAGAGFLSLGHTVSKTSVLDGCDVKSWLLKGAFGFIGGAATGGAGVGITTAVAGIGNVALQSSAVSFIQYAVIGMGTGAVGGVATSLSSDAAKAFVDGENIPIQQLLFRATAGAIIGLIAGFLGGLVTKSIVNNQASAATSALEGDVAEQALISTGVSTGGKRLAKAIALNVSRELTESSTEALLGTTCQVLEERWDDSIENQHPSKHAARAVGTVITKAAKGAAVQTVGSCASHWYKGRKRSGIKAKHISEEPITWQRSKGTALYTPDEESYETNSCTSKEAGERKQSNSSQRKLNMVGKELKESESSNSELYEESQETCYQSDNEEEDDSMHGMIKYRSGGYWYSKMIVTFSLNGEEIKQEVKGDGARVFIPAYATDIEVRFQVRRPFWGDIKKYDRFNKTWCKPYEPHIFRYERPVNRTFTIFGTLRWEAVMRVSDEYHEETDEMR